MQIHELNNYTGDLDSNAFVAVDNGNDTGKLSYSGLMSGVESSIDELDSTLNGRIDNIIAGGEAPSEAEVTDARLGADNIVYGSVGDAIRAQVDDLSSRIGGEISTTMTDGYAISPYDGSEFANAASSITDWIEVTEGQKLLFTGLYVSGTRAVMAYNSGYMKYETVITGSSNHSVTYEVPSGVKYMRATGYSGKTVNVYNISAMDLALSNKADIDELKSTASEIVASETSSIKKAIIDGRYKEFKYPQSFSGAFKPVKLFTDGIHWKTDFNKEDWKVTNGDPKTYYVNLSGTYLNDGLSRDKPVPLYNAITRASDGDTIIIEEGDYRDDIPGYNSGIPTIAKSLNIIGEGTVRIGRSRVITPTYDSDTGLYKYTQSALQGIYDPELDIYYETFPTVAECKTVPNSLCYNEFAPTVYINMSYAHDVYGIYNDVMFVVDATANDIQFYMENVELVGGNCCFQTLANAQYDCLVICDSCKFTYNVGGSMNTCKLDSAKSILHNCKARFAQNDGFSYVMGNGVSGRGFVEIGCNSYSNGFLKSSDSSNGSTAHNNVQGIRVNGNYYDNKGGNVADVQADTQTINCGCAAFNSRATQDGYNEGFGLQQAGATQWLYNCVAFGNFYDFYGVPGTEMIAERCSHVSDNYDTTYHGTITNNNPKKLETINFENTAMIVQQLL